MQALEVLYTEQKQWQPKPGWREHLQLPSQLTRKATVACCAFLKDSSCARRREILAWLSAALRAARCSFSRRRMSRSDCCMQTLKPFFHTPRLSSKPWIQRRFPRLSRQPGADCLCIRDSSSSAPPLQCGPAVSSRPCAPSLSLVAPSLNASGTGRPPGASEGDLICTWLYIGAGLGFRVSSAGRLPDCSAARFVPCVYSWLICLSSCSCHGRSNSLRESLL